MDKPGICDACGVEVESGELLCELCVEDGWEVQECSRCGPLVLGPLESLEPIEGGERQLCPACFEEWEFGPVAEPERARDLERMDALERSRW